MGKKETRQPARIRDLRKPLKGKEARKHPRCAWPGRLEIWGLPFWPLLYAVHIWDARAWRCCTHLFADTHPKMIHTWRAHVCIARQLDMGYRRLRACTSVETNVALRSCADLVPSARPGLAVLAGLVCATMYLVLGRDLCHYWSIVPL